MPQINPFPPAKNPSNVGVPLKVDSSGSLISTVATNPSAAQVALKVDTLGSLIVSGGQSSSLNITTATVVKATPGRLVRIAVTTAGAAGTANDCITTGAAAAANLICTIPATVGVIVLEWPCAVGITITPGAAQVISVSYS